MRLADTQTHVHRTTKQKNNKNSTLGKDRGERKTGREEGKRGGNERRQRKRETDTEPERKPYLPSVSKIQYELYEIVHQLFVQLHLTHKHDYFFCAKHTHGVLWLAALDHGDRWNHFTCDDCDLGEGEKGRGEGER